MTWRDQWAWVQQRMAVEKARKPIELWILKEWLVHHHTVDIREQVPLWDAEQRSSSQPQRSVQLSASGRRRSGV
jgi:hypothetical protein